MEVGDKLNPQRSYSKGFALKGIRQHIKTNNPSTIGPDELLTVPQRHTTYHKNEQSLYYWP